MDDTKRETLMKMKRDIEDMIEASKRRQKGKNVTSENIKARKAKEELKAVKRGGRKYGGKAMSAQDTARNFAGDGEGQGYTPATKISSKDYSKKSTTNSTDQYKAKKKSEDKAPRRSPAAGREDMMSRQRRQEIMDREERKRKNDKDKGGSNVVGS